MVLTDTGSSSQFRRGCEMQIVLEPTEDHLERLTVELESVTVSETAARGSRRSR